ncbi:MAG: phosphomannomutase/phosphoglucomutase [Clostridia bacterium]|nr:phosphomannomutase/phosphoglucomutase [Clostridia bacterium]
MKVIRNINPHIFRGYDIRGIYGEDITEDITYTIGLAYGTYIKEIGKNIAIVGMDNRASSPSLKKALIKGITETGVDVVDIGLVTTPMYYFAWEYLKIPSGMMITASHNPKEYNGFKFSFDESGNTYGETIQKFREYITKATFKKGNGSVKEVNIFNEYVRRIEDSLDISGKELKIIVDPGNGTASGFVKEIFSKFSKLDVTFICDKSDANFPNHHPDPSVEKNLEMLKEAVLDAKADLGLALDGDADRIGVVDNNGKYIPVDHYMIIMARDIVNKNVKNRILFDVKCTKALEDEIKDLGGEFERYRVGNSYIKARMKEGNFAFGGEFSGHIFFRDKWSGFDDGIYAGLRLVELMSNSGKRLEELLQGINKYYSTNEIKIKATEETKNLIVEKVGTYAKGQGYTVNTIDGVRVEASSWWMLIRASQTGPDVTFRFEANTEGLLEEIQKEFLPVIDKASKECKE